MMIMSRLLVIIFLLLCSEVRAQMTEVVRKQYTNATEEYSVLKSDRNLKHGFYRQKTPAGALLIEGYYNNGIQTGLWKQYRNEKLASQGSYADGYKAGAWEYYNAKGKLLQKYDYTAQKVVYYLKDAETQNRIYKVITDRGIIESKIDRPPMFIGGEQELEALIILGLPGININTPIDASVIFVVKKNGETAEHRIGRSAGDIDNELLNAVKTLPHFWIPGLLKGEPVDVIYELPVVLNKD